MCKTILLPFRGRIVYDGMLSGDNLIIGSNMTRELNDAYNAAKKKHGIITTLPWHAELPKSMSKRGTALMKSGQRQSGPVGRWKMTRMKPGAKTTLTRRPRFS